MSLPVGPVGGPSSIAASSTTPLAAPKTGAGLGGVGKASGAGDAFSSLLEGVVQQANQQQHQANAQIDSLVAGKTDNIQDVVMSMAKADLTFQLVLEMRNKLMDAYQEIMRMQV